MFIGIAFDTEFDESRFFFKHKPNFKILYTSPIGESDLTLSNLKGERRTEEIYYQEFVGDYYTMSSIHGLTYLIIPIICFLIISGVFQFLGIIKYNSDWKGILIIYSIILLLLMIAIGINFNFNISGIFIFFGFLSLCSMFIILIYR